MMCGETKTRKSSATRALIRTLMSKTTVGRSSGTSLQSLLHESVDLFAGDDPAAELLARLGLDTAHLFGPHFMLHTLHRNPQELGPVALGEVINERLQLGAVLFGDREPDSFGCHGLPLSRAYAMHVQLYLIQIVKETKVSRSTFPLRALS